MKRLLICDDEPAVREVLSEVLIAAGYGVRTASDGLECLDAIRAEVPDALVLDLRMPRVDGLGVLQEIMNDPRLANIKVVVLRATLPSRRDLEQYGAHLFLRKPVDIDDLTVSLRRLLGS